MNKYQKMKSAETGQTISRKVPESERIVAKNAHEAIVTEEEFEKVQELIRSNSTGKRRSYNSRDYPLKGKARCGSCRRMLVYGNSTKGTRPNGGTFWCSRRYQASELSSCCTELYPEEHLNAKVLQAIERVVYVAQVLEVKLESHNLEEQGVTDPKRLETQIRVMKEERIRQYEGYADGMITRQEYIAVKAKIDRKIEELEADLDEARELLAEEQRILEEIKGISRANLTGEEQTETDASGAAASKKPKPHVLTRALVEAFIDVIYVYDMEHIEVVFKCEDVMKKAMDRTSGSGVNAEEQTRQSQTR